VTFSSPASASSPQANRCDPADAAAVISWNATAAAAIGTDAGLPAPNMGVGMAYVQTAVYNAVVGITREHDLYKWNVRGPRSASVDAAVAAAAHDVLTHYFPVAATRVDSAYSTALAAIPDGPHKTAGVAYGALSAAHLVGQRAGDGWLAPVTFDRAPTLGVWRPTPAAFAPYLVPWLGVMKPFLMTSHDQFRPGPPPPPSSARYALDLLEIQAVGSATSTSRTAAQTTIARFFAGNLNVQLQGAFRDHLNRYCSNASDAAQYLVVGGTAAADGAIAAWDAKLYYGNWRPITAIQLADTDGNRRTEADPGWTPLIPTPSHPDYLSGHCAVIGAVTQALEELTGTDRLDLTLPASVPGTTDRHYDDGATLRAEGIGARIWSGIHSRTADEVGNRTGQRLASWTSSRYFH